MVIKDYVAEHLKCFAICHVAIFFLSLASCNFFWQLLFEFYMSVMPACVSQTVFPPALGVLCYYFQPEADFVVFGEVIIAVLIN